MPDELLEYLGDYYVNEGIRALTGLSFDRFVDYYLSGRWKVII